MKQWASLRTAQTNAEKSSFLKGVAMRRISMFLATLGIALLLAGVAGVFSAFADGGSLHQCSDADEGSIFDSADSTDFDTPNGEIITQVCIKSGTNMFGGEHGVFSSDGTYADGCYTISGIGTDSVSVDRNFESSSCQGISHIDVYWEEGQVEDTPTPTTDPGCQEGCEENTPTPTPSEPGDPLITACINGQTVEIHESELRHNDQRGKCKSTDLPTGGGPNLLQIAGSLTVLGAGLFLLRRSQKPKRA